MRRRAILFLGVIPFLAAFPGLPQTTGGAWQELGPRSQTAGATTRSGRIDSIAIDFADDPTGNTVYVGSAFGGVWKTTNVLSSTPTYVPLMDAQPNLAVGSIALDSSTHPATVYVATGRGDREGDALLHGNGIYKSTDGGRTWTLATSADNGAHPFQQIGFSKILVDPSNPTIVIAGAVRQNLSQFDTPQPFAGIYRSTDAGATWSLVFSPGFIPSCADLVYDTVHGIYYAAINGQGVFKSSNQGASWSATNSPFATASVDSSNFLDAILATRSGSVWVFIVDTTGQPSAPTPCTGGATRCDTGLAQSDDGGASWAPVAAPPVCSGPAGATCFLEFEAPKVLGAPPNSTALVFGNIKLWVASAPSGLATSWTTSQPFNSTNAGDYHSLAFFDDRRWLVGSDLGFAFTSDAATASASIISGNLGTTLSRSASQMGNGAYLTSSQDNAVAERVTGTTWMSFSGGGEGYSDASLTQPNQFFATTFAPFVQRSDDNGQTLVTVVDATVDSIEFPPFQQLPADPTQLVLGTCRVWKGPAIPSAPGAGWMPISADLTANGSGTGACKPGPSAISALAGAPSSADVIYAVTFDGHALRTTNATSANPAWNDLTHASLPNSSRFPLHAAAVSPTDSNTAYVGAGGTGSGHVFMTRDGGTSWTDITGNLPDLSVHAILIDPLAPQDLYIGTAAGVFVVRDGGNGGSKEVWQQYGTALPNAEVLSLEFTKVGIRQIIAATYGRGVWTIAPLAASMVQLSATSVAFNPQQTGTTSTPQTVTLTNNGSIVLGITGIALAGANRGDFAQSNTCGASVAAGANCTLSITFMPAAAGTRTASLTITDSAAGSPQTIILTGTGTAPDFSIGAASGGSTTTTVVAGQTAMYNLALMPSGFSGTVTLTCSGAPTAATCSVSPTAVTVGGTTASSFDVNVATTSRSMLTPWTKPSRGVPFRGAPLVLMLLVMFIVFALRNLARTRPLKVAFILPTAMLAGVFLIGCGGGGASSAPSPGPTVNGTPAGTYTLTVTGTSGNVTHTISLTLVVN
jgi:hypothetical protein